MGLRALIFGLLAVCIGGSTLVIFPNHFDILLVIGIWGTSLPHTLSTFIRRDLLRPYPILLAVIVMTALIFLLKSFSNSNDRTLLFTSYFFLQQFHYARQSFGISRFGLLDKQNTIVENGFYLGVTGLSVICALTGGAQYFFGYAIKNPTPVSLSAELATSICAILMGLYFITAKKEKWIHGATHVLLNVFCFVVLKDFFTGWFILNLYHNAQYLSLYMNLSEGLFLKILPILLSMGMLTQLREIPAAEWFIALNFTHYLWDSIIWRKFKLT